LTLKQKDQKKIFLYLFYVGLVVFALGIVAFLANLAIPSPMPPDVYIAIAGWSMPFLNWVTIAGIALAVVGFIGNIVLKGKKQEA
jgi:hypothetical protein